MFRRLALVATLVAPALAGGCYKIDNCNLPAEPFALDEELTLEEVKRMIELSHVIDRNNLECAVVCENIYLDQHPDGAATTVDSCTMVLDGPFNDDPDEVEGSLQCTGRGIPQFCEDG